MSSARTPVTSVARCITFARCRTNGVSGTFVVVQCGAGVGDRADGVLVLLEVLARAGERPGQCQVARVVAAAPDGPGQDPGRHHPLLAPHQQLRRRADQAVDVERPAARVALRQPAAAASAGRCPVGAGVQVTGQDDLLDVALADPRDRVGDGGGPAAGRACAVGVRHRARRRRRLSAGGHVGQRRDDGAHPIAVSHHRSCRWPRTSRGRRAPRRPATTRRRRRTRRPPDRCRGGRRRPGRRRAGPARARRARRRRSGPRRRLDARRLAPGHQALAAAHPGQGVLPRQDVQQRAGVRDGDRAGDERHGGRCCCHRRSA